MTEFCLYHPEPTAPRPVSKIRATKLKRLRTIWFILGCTSGIVVSSLSMQLYNTFSSDSAPTQEYAETSQIDIGEDGALVEGDDDIATAENEATEPIAEPIALEWPRNIRVKAQSGDTLAGILTHNGIAANVSYNLLEQMKKVFHPRRLRAGHYMTLHVDKDESRTDELAAAKLLSLTLELSSLESVQIDAKTSDPNSFNVRKVKAETKLVTARAAGTIGDGQTISGVAGKQGMPIGIGAKLLKAFSYDLDFQRDIRKGDSFEILYEKEVTEDGRIVASGDLKYAMLNARGKKRELYYFKQGKGSGQFYYGDGKSIVKKLLRTPVDGARITSKFGRRRHPILGYSKMHKGIDFGASRGTKIYAAGDGVVTFAGRKGGYGNYVMIRHKNSPYTTAYAHCHKFARGMRKGKTVKQGQVIAYVGSTGRSTGPHLHYEIIKNGKHINPAGVKFLGDGKLRGKSLRSFNYQKDALKKKVKSLAVAPVEKAPVKVEDKKVETKPTTAPLEKK